MKEQKHETRAKKAKLAISYITTGTLMMVWAVVWLLWLIIPGISGVVSMACGVIFSGLAVVIIGMKVGDIGKEANHDEPETEAPPVVVNAQTPANTTPAVTPRRPQPINQD